MTKTTEVKILIPTTADQAIAWDTAALRCRIPRQDWMVHVLNYVIDLGAAPVVIDAKAKPVDKKPVSRINLRCSSYQHSEWSKRAKRAHLPTATWARLMLNLAAEASFAEQVVGECERAASCTTFVNRRRK